MFCKESSSSLQTLSITKNLSSLLPKPSTLINFNLDPILRTGDRHRRNLSRRCKVTASRGSNVDQKSKIVTEKVKKIKVKGFITAQEGLLDGISISRPLDDLVDIMGKSLLVELISAENDTGNMNSNLSSLVT